MNGIFDPSIGGGTFNIQYFFEDTNGCSNSSTAQMLVSGLLLGIAEFIRKYLYRCHFINTHRRITDRRNYILVWELRMVI
ncbi:MAG: hypothetical protein IPN88_08615 [Bacteroidetes bacterium]|nr:hypothetical protein [Bacteroidota bacterium]